MSESLQGTVTVGYRVIYEKTVVTLMVEVCVSPGVETKFCDSWQTSRRQTQPRGQFLWDIMYLDSVIREQRKVFILKRTLHKLGCIVTRHSIVLKRYWYSLHPVTRWTLSFWRAGDVSKEELYTINQLQEKVHTRKLSVIPEIKSFFLFRDVNDRLEDSVVGRRQGIIKDQKTKIF